MGGRIVRLGRDVRGDGDEEGMDVEERTEDVEGVEDGEGDVSLELESDVSSDVSLALDLRIICSWHKLGPPSLNMISRDSMNFCDGRCMRRKALR